MGTVKMMGIVEIAKKLQQWGRREKVRHVKGVGKDGLEWLAENGRGAYLVPVYELMVANTFPVVNGARQLIINNVERYLRKLNLECFRHPAGVEAKQLSVGEIGEVVAQVEVKNMMKRNGKVVVYLAD